MGLGSILKKVAGAAVGLVPGGSFLQALAPVVASGASSLIKSKQNSNTAKTLEAQRKQDALAADAKAKLDWEAQQNSPAAQTARFKSTVALGKLAGKFGGVAGVPPSIAKYYQSLRTMPEYTGQSSYQEPVKSSGGGWNLAAGIADALGYLDTTKLGKPKSDVGLMSAGNQAAYNTGQLKSLMTTPVTNPFGPKNQPTLPR